MHKLRLFTVLAGLAFLAACQEQASEQAETTDPAVDTAAEEDAIHALGDSYETAYNAGTTDAVLTLYTDDAVVILHDGTTTTPAEDVNTNMTEAPGSSIAIDPERTTVGASGDVAHETGTYTIMVPGPDGQPVSQTMRYVVGLKKVDGTWKLDTVISTAPIAADAPADAEATTTE